MVVFLKNKNNGKIKKGIVGFSWTTFFFGLFVPLLRRDFKIFLPFFFLYMAILYMMPYTYSDIDGIFSFRIEDNIGIYQQFSTAFYFIVNILGAFFYNKFYTQNLIYRRYYPMSEETEVILNSNGIFLPHDYHHQKEDDENS